MNPKYVVAAFDVDGTLTRRDCVIPFLVRVGGRRALVVSLIRRPLASLGALARRDRDTLKEIVVGGVLAGRAVDEVDRVAVAFAADVHRRGLRPDVVERLRWHQAAGHRTVLVSASLGVYLRPLAALLGVDAVLATEVETADGAYGWRLVGGNCRAAVKAERLAAWLRAMDVEGAEVWAYGDSNGDRELLACAHHPLHVGGIVVDREPQVTR